MKILRTLLYILLALVLVLVLLGFVGPKSYDVSRTAAINAPPPVVLPYLKSLKKQNEWGPWLKHDPGMELTYEGEDGTVGSISRWKSKQAGKGEQKVTSIEGNTVETELTFYMPWGANKSTGYLHAAEAQGGSEVTWGMRGENDFIGRIFAVFTNMEKGVGPMFEEGLQSLKATVEGNMNKEDSGLKVNTVDFAGHQYVAARATIAMTEIGGFMGQHSGRIAGELAKANLQMTGPPSGLYFSWDETTGKTDMAVAFPVDQPATIPNTEMITVPPGRALSIDYYGAYIGIHNAHTAIDEYSQANGLKTKSPAIEEYITGQQTEPDSTKWLTKIYYLLDQ